MLGDFCANLQYFAIKEQPMGVRALALDADGVPDLPDRPHLRKRSFHIPTW
jgi:hypothetical protein